MKIHILWKGEECKLLGDTEDRNTRRGHGKMQEGKRVCCCRRSKEIEKKYYV